MSRLDQLRKFAQSQPDDAFAQYGVGLECMQLERWDEALAAFDLALAADASYVAAFYQKALAEVKLGQRSAAATTLKAGMPIALEANETHAVAEMRKMLETLA